MAVRPAARAALTAASAYEATTATLVAHATRLWRRRRAPGREAGRASGFDDDVGARGDDGDAGGARNAPYGGGGVLMAVRPAARAALTATSAHEATTATLVAHATRPVAAAC